MQTNEFIEKEFTSFIDRLNVYLSRSNKKLKHIKFQEPDIIEFSVWDEVSFSAENFNKTIPNKKGVKDVVYKVYDAKR